VTIRRRHFTAYLQFKFSTYILSISFHFLNILLFSFSPFYTGYSYFVKRLRPCPVWGAILLTGWLINRYYKTSLFADTILNKKEKLQSNAVRACTMSRSCFIAVLCVFVWFLLANNRWLWYWYVADSREQAFVQSLSTALLVQAVSKACSAGLSSHCGCGPIPTDPPPDHPSEQFQWGGCPDDLPHGLAFSRAFEQRRPSSNKRRKMSRRALINEHNSDVGRQVINATLK